MPFGATPVWPWIWSKKPTPEIVAVPLSFLNDLDGAPHAAISAVRARFIFVLAIGVAPAVHDLAGSSAIIVAPVLLGSAITRWMSLSSSSFISTSFAWTRNVVCSTPRPRRRPRSAGTLVRRSERIVVAFGLRLSVRPAGSASVFTDQRSMPQPTCFELGAVVFAGASPTHAKGTIVRPRRAIASPVRLEIRT